MNIFNRIVIVLLSLVAIILCSTLLIAPVAVLRAVALQAGSLADALTAQPWYVVLGVGVVVALLFDAVLCILIVCEVYRPPQRAIRIEKAAGGVVMVSVASIADRLKYELDQLPGVLRVRPKVRGKRGGVVLDLDVEVAFDANVPEKSERILETARRVVEDDMGLKVSRPPKVNLQSVSYSQGWRTVVKPPSPPPPASQAEPPAQSEAEVTKEE